MKVQVQVPEITQCPRDPPPSFVGSPYFLSHTAVHFSSLQLTMGSALTQIRDAITS